MANVSSDVGADEIVQAILAPLTKEELVALVNRARAAEGRAVATASWDDGDLCPVFKFPFPPRHLQDFLNQLMLDGRGYRVFPLGIPVPEEVLVQVHNKAH